MLEVDHQVGEEDVDAHHEEGQRDHDLEEVAVALEAFQLEGVGDLTPVTAGGPVEELFLAQERHAHQSDERSDAADDVEEPLVADGLDDHTRAAVDDEEGNPLHDLQRADHPPAVGIGGHVGDVGAESGVGGGGSKEGHQAVKEDGDENAHGHGLELGCRGECRGEDAPQNVTDEQVGAAAAPL